MGSTRTMRIALAPYTFRVRKLNQAEVEQFGAMSTGIDFLDLLEQYLNARMTSAGGDEIYKRVLGCTRVERPAGGRMVHGTVMVGDHGYTSVLVNRITEEVTHERGSDEAELMPFYFRFEAPAKSHQGILIVQKTGSRGIRKTLVADFQEWIRKRQLGFKIDVYKPCRTELLEQYIKPHRVTVVRFIRRFKKADIADNVADGPQELAGDIELHVKAPRGLGLPLWEPVSEIVNGRKQLASLVEIEALQAAKDFPFDDVKVQVVGGKQRHTVDIGHLSDFSPPHDVTAKVDLEASGHPSFKSIAELAAALAREVRAGVMQVVDDA